MSFIPIPNEYFTEQFYTKHSRIFTNDVLCNALQSVNQPKSGTKKDLISRIIIFMGQPRHIQVEFKCCPDEMLIQVLKAVKDKNSYIPETILAEMNTFEPSIITQWLSHNTNKIDVDIKNMYEKLNTTIYGSYTWNQVIPFLLLSESDKASIKSFNFEQWPKHCVDAIKHTNQFTQAIANFTSQVRQGNYNVIPPSIPKMSHVELVYDKGYFPRLIYHFDYIVMTTLPFGISSNLEIVSVCGLLNREYTYLMGKPLNDTECRKLAYLISVNLGFKPYYVSESPIYDLTSLNHIINLPELYASLKIKSRPALIMFLNKLDIPLTLSIGQRECLRKIYGDVCPKFPCAIEDYIIIEDLNPDLVTPGIKKIVDEPADYIRDYILESIPSYRHRGTFSPLGLKIVPTVENYKHMQFHNADMHYLLACMGFNMLNATVSIKDAVVCVNLKQAGCIGDTVETVKPMDEKFINYMFDSLDSDHYKNVCDVFDIQHFDLFTLNQIKSIFVRGYINPLPYESPYAELVEKWNNFNNEQKEVIGNVYHINDLNGYIKQKYHYEKMEDYIRRYKDPENFDSIIEELGMIVPHGISKSEYIMNNLHLYNQVLNRPIKDDDSNMSAMTDKQVYKVYGAIFGHTSRRTLRQNGQKFNDGGTMFFIPNIRNPTNEWTFDSNPNDLILRTPTRTTDQLMIAYGTKNEYVLYQLIELQSGYMPHDEEKTIFSYRRINPANPGEYLRLSRTDSTQLLELLKVAWGSFSAEDQLDLQNLIQMIEDVDYHFRTVSDHDRHIIRQFKPFSQELRMLIKTALSDIFYIGMRFRQWQGPGNPFPLRKEETRTLNFDPDLNTLEARNKFDDTLDMLRVYPSAYNFLMSLHKIEHADGEISKSSSETLNMFWNKIIGRDIAIEHERNREIMGPDYEQEGLIQDAGMCIRMASSYLVGTGHYYTQLFFKEQLGADEVGGYDYKIVSKIQ